jgi:transposase
MSFFSFPNNNINQESDMSFQGVEFTPEMRKMVVNVKQFFDSLKTVRNDLEKPASQLTASALDISESTVKVIMAAFNRKGNEGLNHSRFGQRGRRTYTVEPGIEPVIRQFIRKANRNGDRVNIEIIRQFMRDKLRCEVPRTTLRRALQRWGFEFGTGIRSAQLKESERVVIMRRQYLRLKRANRDVDGQTDRPEVYLDESYINKNHSNDNTWYFEEDGIIIGKPTGKGERLIIVNAITKDGWVPNARLVFKASEMTGDYHTNMNWDNFSEWFQEKLLCNIPENSLIIMDNAAYHNVLAEEAFPKKSHSVKRMREWLSNNAIPWTKDMLKAELFELCSRLATKPEFLIDNIANKYGHSVLRTPPYHPELQPIETCWAIVKNHVAQQNDCTMKKVLLLLEEGFAKVNEKTCHNLIKKVNSQEDAFWVEDTEKTP